MLLADFRTKAAFIVAVSFWSGSAYAAQTDYDGAWKIDYKCSASSQNLKAGNSDTGEFHASLGVHVKDGTFSASKDSSSRDSWKYHESWSGTITGSEVVIKAPGTSDGNGRWEYNLKGRVVSPHEMTVSGVVFAWAADASVLARICEGRLISTAPAPLSLAGKEPEPPAEAQPQTDALGPASASQRQQAEATQKKEVQPRVVQQKAPASAQGAAPRKASAPTKPGPTPSTGPAAVPAPQQPDDPIASAPTGAMRLDLKNNVASRIGVDSAQKIIFGDDGDLLLFSNETSQAPHFARRLSGETYFQDNIANVCTVGQPQSPEPAFEEYARRAILRGNSQLKISSASVYANPCDSVNWLANSDIVAIRRLDIISSTEIKETLVSLIEGKHARILMSVERAPFNLLLEDHKADAKKIDAELKAGTLNGIGLLVASNSRQNICAANTENPEFVSRAVAAINTELLFDKRPGENPDIQMASPDDIFLSAKADRCGFIFGDGALLKAFSDAFDRDGYQIQIAPVILPRDRADALLAALQAEQQAAEARLAQEQKDRDQRIAEEQKIRAEQKAAQEQQRRLDEARKQSEDAVGRAELDRIHKLVAFRGQTLVDAFEQRIRRHMESVVNEVAETRRRARLEQPVSEQEEKAQRLRSAPARMEEAFPAWSSSLETSVKEDWEYGAVKATLEDYGQAKWHSREIEAVAVRVEFPMSNAQTGERRTGCDVFIWINDEEFSAMRQPESFDCSAYEQGFMNWSQSSGFTSQWKSMPR